MLLPRRCCSGSLDLDGVAAAARISLWRLSAPEHAVPSLLQRLGYVSLRRFRFPARRKRTYPFHQIPSQPHTKLVRLASRQHSSCLVLREAVFGRVGGLADIDWRERTRLRDAVS